MKNILLVIFCLLISPIAQADFTWNPFTEEFDRVLSVNEIDDNFIQVDGTSTTTAKIPFGSTLLIFFRGMFSSRLRRTRFR